MSILTRCPHCQTCFRVSDEQLNMASGKVRCGHCMGVFNAREAEVVEHQREKPPAPPQQQPEPPPQPKPAQREKPEEPTAAPSTNDDSDELIFADNPEEDETESGYSGDASILAGDELSDSFLSLAEESGTLDDEDEEQAEEPVDESWAEQMLLDDAEVKSPEKSEPKKEAPSRSSPKPPPEPERKPALALEPTDRDAVDDEPPLTAGTRIMTPDKAERKEKTEKTQEPADYRELRPEPVAIGRQGRGGGLRRAVWTLVILALLGVIGSQLAYFQFDRLSRVEALRPFYETACHWVGCKLPELVDVSKIKSQKLVVRSDPDNPALLVVDAIIVNQAHYQQPFPAIGLTFSNLNNDVVAQRIFHPGEYLKGDIKGMKNMPPDTPFQIELRIKDPGQDAVNYNIEFLPEHSPRATDS